MNEREIDQELVERAQAGDKKAFELLVEKYQRKLGRLLSRFVRDHAEVEEAHRALELAQQGNVLRFPAPAASNSSSEPTASEAAEEDDDEPWPDFREMV